jgi:hypothetical protein
LGAVCLAAASDAAVYEAVLLSRLGSGEVDDAGVVALLQSGVSSCPLPFSVSPLFSPKYDVVEDPE